MGFPGGASGKEPACQCRRHEMWVRSQVVRIPWRRKWQPTLVIFAWRIPWTEELGRLQSMGSWKGIYYRNDLASNFYCIDISQCIYPFTSHLACSQLWLLQVMLLCTSLYMDIYFHLSWIREWVSGKTESYDRCIFNILENAIF